jgi:hypothetical protein
MSLYTVATGRWSWFYGAFVMFSAIDASAGFYHLNRRDLTSYMVAESVMIGSAIISVFLLRYLWKHWPSQPSGTADADPETRVPL